MLSRLSFRHVSARAPDLLEDTHQIGLPALEGRDEFGRGEQGRSLWGSGWVNGGLALAAWCSWILQKSLAKLDNYVKNAAL